MIENSQVLGDDSEFDHCYLSFELEIDKRERVKYRNPRKIGWDCFIMEVEMNVPEFIGPILTHGDLDNFVEGLSVALVNGFQRSCSETILRDR